MAKPVRAAPSVQAIEKELQRLRYKQVYRKTLRSTLLALITMAAVVVLISVLVLPVFRTHGDGMSPTLESGQLVATLRTSEVEPGDVIAFYYNNKILIKRVVAVGGDTVDIDVYGNVTVNGEPLEEPYLTAKDFGECNISLPYEVPQSKVFVLGDNRATSVDSRHTEIGCPSQEQIIGKVIWRLWPFEAITAL